MLSGCGPTGPTPTPTPTAAGVSESPSPSPTPEVPIATSLRVALDRLVVLDQNGADLTSAAFDDPDAVLALVAQVTGSTPEPVDNQKFGVLYEWPEIRVILNFSTASVRITSATVAGLPVSTSQGIHVGSTRDEVLALDPVAEEYDGDGDGLPDTYGLEPATVPGTDSLSHPGQAGTAYIVVFMSGDTVASIGTPSGDYLDV